MLRVTRQTDYGIVLLTHMAQQREAHHTARDLAHRTRLPLPMVGKILKLLTRAEVLVSQRGAKGGYALARSPQDTTVADVISALEGPIAITECANETPGHCDREDYCRVRANWQRVNLAIRVALENLTLAELGEPAAELVAVRGYPKPTSLAHLETP